MQFYQHLIAIWPLLILWVGRQLFQWRFEPRHWAERRCMDEASWDIIYPPLFAPYGTLSISLHHLQFPSNPSSGLPFVYKVFRAIFTPYIFLEPRSPFVNNSLLLCCPYALYHPSSRWLFYSSWYYPFQFLSVWCVLWFDISLLCYDFFFFGEMISWGWWEESGNFKEGLKGDIERIHLSWSWSMYAFELTYHFYLFIWWF